MAQKTDHYRAEGENRIIDVAIRDLNLLFNPMDPSPASERDLDANTEDYILGALREIGMKTPVKLVFHVPEDQIASTDPGQFAGTIHNYFAYRAWASRMTLGHLIGLGWVSLAIGLAFMTACLIVRSLLAARISGMFAPILDEGLIIIGWVAMWRPIEIFLYAWWPIVLDRRRYLKLADAPITINPLQDDQMARIFRRTDRGKSAPRP